MKVLNLVTGDEGGGGRAAYRLNAGLRGEGCDAQLYLASKFHHDPATLVYRPPGGLAAKLRRAWRRAELRGLAWRFRTRPPFFDYLCQRGAEPLRQMPAAEVYNLHTISNFVDYEALFRHVPPAAKIVWTLHLMQPFTGGCTYAEECSHFTGQCGNCPQLAHPGERDASRHNWREKHAIYGSLAEGRLQLVAPSRWMAAEAARSTLLGRFPIEVIPYGIDTASYAPRDRAMARQALGLPAEAKVVLFATQHQLALRTKGFSWLEAALRQMRTPGLFLLALGAGELPADLPLPARHLGHVFDDRLLSIIYSAADVFAIPSLCDNLPNVVLEAFACGTPAVAFEVGGLPDMVRPGMTGELARAADAEDLARQLTRLLEDDSRRREIGANCRRVAVAEYDLSVQARRYLELYARLGAR